MNPAIQPDPEHRLSFLLPPDYLAIYLHHLALYMMLYPTHIAPPIEKASLPLFETHPFGEKVSGGGRYTPLSYFKPAQSRLYSKL